MSLNFTKVSYDGDLSEFSEDELLELIREYEQAQDSNVAEFEQAAEQATDIDESAIKDFQEARKALVAEITESEDFDEVPLGADALTGQSFTELQEWRDFVLGGDAEGDDADSEGDDGVSDFGTRSPSSADEDDTDEMIDNALDQMQGLNI